MDNSNLESAIAIRVFDILGIFSKEMPDIRNDNYLITESIWAGKLIIDEENQIIFLYSEKNDNRYMITKYLHPKSSWFNLVSLDQEDCELNKIYVSIEVEEKIKFRDISYVEIADLLKGFELIRQYMPNWLAYEPDSKDLDILSNFIKSICIEE
jgi:hypothetical protein